MTTRSSAVSIANFSVTPIAIQFMVEPHPGEQIRTGEGFPGPHVVEEMRETPAHPRDSVRSSTPLLPVRLADRLPADSPNTDRPAASPGPWPATARSNPCQLLRTRRTEPPAKCFHPGPA